MDTIIVSSLELQLDPSRRRASRKGRPCVDLGGNGRLWRVLALLAVRHDAYVTKRELIATVWDDLGAVTIEDTTLWGALSQLRRYLLPLRITIKFVKGLGYTLVAQPDASIKEGEPVPETLSHETSPRS